MKPMINRPGRLCLFLLVSLLTACLPVLGCAQRSPPQAKKVALAGHPQAEKIAVAGGIVLPKDDPPVLFKTVSERTRSEHPLVREPVYQSKQPRYCLLVLGPDAAKRIWIVLDGNTLFIDRNGNGDLTESDEPIKAESGNDDGAYFRVSILGADDKTKHTLHVFLTKSSLFGQEKDGPFTVHLSLSWTRNRTFGAWGDETGLLFFAVRPQDAPVIHMDGPLQMGFETHLPLIKKAKDTYELNVGVGTKGIGKGSFAHLQHEFGAIPPGAHPRAVLEFPNKVAGDPPWRIETVLKERC